MYSGICAPPSARVVKATSDALRSRPLNGSYAIVRNRGDPQVGYQSGACGGGRDDIDRPQPTHRDGGVSIATEFAKSGVTAALSFNDLMIVGLIEY